MGDTPIGRCQSHCAVIGKLTERSERLTESLTEPERLENSCESIFPDNRCNDLDMMGLQSTRAQHLPRS